MIQYILLTTLLIFLIVFITIKIRYPFWNIQPVFHYYDYWRYLYREPFAIYRYVPLKTKFCDFEQVFTFPYLECSDKQKQQLLNLLQCYYLPSHHIIHNITESDVNIILTGFQEPSYVSFYYEKEKTTIPGAVSLQDYNQEPVGCITSIPVNMFFLPTLREPEYTERKMYFVNTLVVNRNRNQQKINRSLLQTHEYNQRVMNPTIHSTIIKKEVDLLDGVIPCVELNTTTFYIKDVKFPSLPPNNVVTEINSDNFCVLDDFLKDMLNINYSSINCYFNMIILPDVTNMYNLIKTDQLLVYILRERDQVLGVYIFKDTRLQHEKLEGNTIHFIASIMNNNNHQAFYVGFLFALKSILKKKKNYKVLVFDSISHNDIILSQWLQHNKPISITKTGYYLFNYIIPMMPFNQTKTFISV